LIKKKKEHITILGQIKIIANCMNSFSKDRLDLSNEND